MSVSIKETEEATAKAFIEALSSPIDGKWVMPWDRTSEFPTNPTTGKDYAGGFNGFVLMMGGLQYGDNRWAGFGQWKKTANRVKEGETGTPIFFPRFKCSACGVAIGWGKKCRNGHSVVKSADKSFSGWGSSFVFNNQQTTSPLASAEVKDVDPAEGFARADALVQTLGADFRHGGGRAFYSPREDYIMVPEAGKFTSVEAYWATTLHEHAHWSGHSSRLNRPGIAQTSGFGGESYAFEELVAEMGAAFVCKHIGIEKEGLFDNHVKYIASWKKALTDDPSILRKACQQAGAVMRYLLDKGEGKGRG
jgi:antirestriction protein ArdC